ncbi:MAG TPA: hypothetical protein PLN21_06465 [Gemmatales bacterium]|nr:hypothetical protein [Gemmatales bacterium]
MYYRYLIACLAVMTFALCAMADVHRNDENQFEARFPTKAQRLTKALEGGGQIIMAHSHDLTRTYIVGVIAGSSEEMSSEQLQEFGTNFVEGYIRERKNATIINEEELKLNDTTPKGVSYLVKHDAGNFFAWTTIENGKGYFVIIEGPSEASLQGEVVKNFKNSVKIMSVK